MENLTDEQVTKWKEDITEVLSNLSDSLINILDNAGYISRTISSNDPSLSNSWSQLHDAIENSQVKLDEKRTIFDDTLTTFVSTVVALNEEMVSEVQLAENEFTDFYNRIAAV